MQKSRPGTKYILGKDGKTPLLIGRIKGSKGIPHQHDNVFEYFIVAKGSMSMKVTGKTVKMKEGDALMVEPKETHRITKYSDDLDCYIIKFPNDNTDKRLDFLGLKIKVPKLLRK